MPREKSTITRLPIDVQPVFGEPALLLRSKQQRVLAIADLHIGLKYQWEREGVFIPDQKKRLIEKIRSTCLSMRISRLIVIGDFKHHIPKRPWEKRRKQWEKERTGWDQRLDEVIGKKKALEKRITAGGADVIPKRDQEMLYNLELEKMRQVSKIRERRNEILDKLPPEEEAVNDVLGELQGFLEQVDIIKGNHDGRLETMVDSRFEDFVTIHKAEGFLYEISEKIKYEKFGGEEAVHDDRNRSATSSIGFFHGHKWPGPGIVAADIIVVGHTHYSFMFEDKIGAKIVEPVWIRGAPTKKMRERYPTIPKEFILMPSFNPLLSTKPINSKHPRLYGPMLKNGYLNIEDAEIYLFDGTALGRVGDFVRF